MGSMDYGVLKSGGSSIQNIDKKNLALEGSSLRRYNEKWAERFGLVSVSLALLTIMWSLITKNTGIIYALLVIGSISCFIMMIGYYSELGGGALERLKALFRKIARQ